MCNVGAPRKLSSSCISLSSDLWQKVTESWSVAQHFCLMTVARYVRFVAPIAVALMLLASGAVVASCDHTHTTNFVARGRAVPPTGNRALDELFARVRILQLSLNESERFYLDTMTTLSVELDRVQMSERESLGDAGVRDAATLARFGTSSEPDLAGLANFVHSRSDLLRTQGRVLQLEMDTSSAEQLLASPNDPSGTCGVVTSVRGVRDCLTQLRGLVLVRVTEVSGRPTGQTGQVGSDDGDSTENATDDELGEPSMDPGRPVSIPFVDATVATLSSLIALRLRMDATGTRAAQLRREFAELPVSSLSQQAHRTEVAAAVQFLADAATRAEVQSRLVRATADSLADGLHRGTQLLVQAPAVSR